ncbi:MAG: HD domain-containing phosphohydrolase [Candidatus Pristimantibacillus sp.]
MLEFKSSLTAEQMLKIIFEYTAKIANENMLHSVLILMADMGREMILADRCAVWLIDSARNELFTTVAHGSEEIRIPYGSGLVGHSIHTGQPLFIDDAYSDPRHNPEYDQLNGYHTKSVLTVPFHNNDGEVIGAYQAVNKLTDTGTFSTQDMDYLSLAASYSGKSLEAIMLHEEIIETQKEIIVVMGEIGENRSKETGNHVKRVAEYSYQIALGLGMTESEASLLRMASPMHDIGKVGIPDAILLKPGKLTDEEFAIMQTHVDIGYQLLRNSKRKILQAAAIVASQHHEKWDGTGYPRGIQGEDIHLYGRITAIADVFDALGSDRVYKAAWDLDRIFALLQEERGKHFDPRVVDAFFNQLPYLLEIRDNYVG